MFKYKILNSPIGLIKKNAIIFIGLLFPFTIAVSNAAEPNAAEPADIEYYSGYVGAGVAKISGTSAGDKFSETTAPVITVGLLIGESFAFELSTKTFSSSKTSDAYRLRYAYSGSFIASLALSESFAVVGKLGRNTIKFNRTRNSGVLARTSGVLEATGLNYGVGFRYSHISGLFVDALYEQLAKKTIDGRNEDIKQLSFTAKQYF